MKPHFHQYPTVFSNDVYPLFSPIIPCIYIYIYSNIIFVLSNDYPPVIRYIIWVNYNISIDFTNLTSSVTTWAELPHLQCIKVGPLGSPAGADANEAVHQHQPRHRHAPNPWWNLWKITVYLMLLDVLTTRLWWFPMIYITKNHGVIWEIQDNHVANQRSDMIAG